MKRPKIIFGRNLIDKVAKKFDSFIVITTQPPWNLVRGRIGRTPAKCVFVRTMEREWIEEVAKDCPRTDAVLGIGGGAAIDLGKYIAWKTGAKLIAIPTIISADAVVTREVAVREGGRVRYVGNKMPDEVLIDYATIQNAPKRLNRAGAGDILSIHTALYDWKLASEKHLEKFDEDIAKESKNLIRILRNHSPEIREVTEEGIKLLMELYLKETELCHRFGSSRPEEGSEHFLAYNLEYLTRKRFLHGEAVGLGVFLMAHIQNNEPNEITQTMEWIGLNYKPSAVGVTPSEVREALATLKKYVEEERLPYSIINEVELTDATIYKLVEKLSSG